MHAAALDGATPKKGSDPFFYRRLSPEKGSDPFFY